MKVRMDVILKRRLHGQRSLIRTGSRSTKVQDTVIMILPMIMTIWIFTAECIRHCRR